MGLIIINAAAKIFLAFSPISANLIREEDNTVPVTLNYTNGTGQTMTAGQVLYITGTSGQPGYLEVRVVTATTLTGTGSVSLTVLSHPTATQADQAVNFDFDQSTITLNLDYNSKPATSDVTVNLANRAVHDFTTAEFLAAYTDFDTDAMTEMMATGTLTGYEYDVNGTNNYVPYTGTWIPVNNIARLRYTAADQNAAYTQSNPWFAKDAQGNISE
jgi:hypothetical protein